MYGFDVHIKTEVNDARFIFNRIAKADGIVFFVTVKDDKHKSHFFKMDVRGGVWKIVNAASVAPWILAVEADLGKAIHQRL